MSATWGCDRIQTFLPYRSFERSASVLDRARLNKQRIECLQICHAVSSPEYGWQYHPAVNQWRGYLYSLADYGIAIHHECQRRGIADDKEVGNRIMAFQELAKLDMTDLEQAPPWLGDPRLHRSHRSNLMRKAPEHYRRYWPKMRPDLPYFWPSKMVDYASIPGSTYKKVTT